MLRLGTLLVLIGTLVFLGYQTLSKLTAITAFSSDCTFSHLVLVSPLEPEIKSGTNLILNRCFTRDNIKPSSIVLYTQGNTPVLAQVRAATEQGYLVANNSTPPGQEPEVSAADIVGVYY